MGRVQGMKGMRHIALNVKDVTRSKRFYQAFFGTEVVWEPDPKNAYLSSGCDNLALHEIPQGRVVEPHGHELDHLGFIVESGDRVRQL
ncbi:MAG: VOC family protein, partial [Deltaproteobacteria bacterium]|nr:VOC family protein [Deltaproteobacteria bacterium]